MHNLWNLCQILKDQGLACAMIVFYAIWISDFMGERNLTSLPIGNLLLFSIKQMCPQKHRGTVGPTKKLEQFSSPPKKPPRVLVTNAKVYLILENFECPHILLRSSTFGILKGLLVSWNWT